MVERRVAPVLRRSRADAYAVAFPGTASRFGERPNQTHARTDLRDGSRASRPRNGSDKAGFSPMERV